MVITIVFFFFFYSHLFTAQIVNGTNTTLRYDQRQQTEPVEAIQLEYLIPAQLQMSLAPSAESNETVPFPQQAEFQILTADGRLCVNLGYQGDWVIEASLDNTTGDPNARLEGIFEMRLTIQWNLSKGDTIDAKKCSSCLI